MPYPLEWNLYLLHLVEKEESPETPLLLQYRGFNSRHDRDITCTVLILLDLCQYDNFVRYPQGIGSFLSSRKSLKDTINQEAEHSTNSLHRNIFPF